MPKKQINPVKDVVHGYIPLSPLERVIVDTRHFQRLHLILQNSSTYTAYPNNKNSRFAHSLGVAHVAGQIFCHAVNNSTKETLNAVLDTMRKFVGQYVAGGDRNMATLEASWLNCVDYQFSFQHRPIDNSISVGNVANACPSKNSTSVNPLFLLNTFGVAVRVCGLIHDIGHLPMSHIFENALKERLKDLPFAA